MKDGVLGHSIAGLDCVGDGVLEHSTAGLRCVKNGLLGHGTEGRLHEGWCVGV